MGDPKKKSALFEQFARMGRALANGKRLELLDVLIQGERSVENLAAATGLGLSTASAHLQALKRAGLVTTRRAGTRIYYGVAGEDVARLYHQMRTVARTRLADVEQKRQDYLGLSDHDDVQEITRGELLARLESGTVTIVDVRPVEEYQAAHIPGAASIPLEELSNRISELPLTVEVVAYCRGEYCVLAHDAVRLLTVHGFTASRLNDGMPEWRLAMLPVHIGAAA